jgi:hypothetical protein
VPTPAVQAERRPEGGGIQAEPPAAQPLATVCPGCRRSVPALCLFCPHCDHRLLADRGDGPGLSRDCLGGAVAWACLLLTGGALTAWLFADQNVGGCFLFLLMFVALCSALLAAQGHEAREQAQGGPGQFFVSWLSSFTLVALFTFAALAALFLLCAGLPW